MHKNEKKSKSPVSGAVPWQRLILTGCRATGKSRIGRLLADHYCCDFVDTDTLVSGQAGQTISALTATKGWQAFRRMEREALAGLSARTGLVIATGGGAILHEDVWRSLRKRSIVCWLTAEPATILDRLSGDPDSADTRPPLTDLSLEEEIRNQLARREPLYRKGSDFAVSTDRKSPQAICGEIARWLEGLGTGT